MDEEFKLCWKNFQDNIASGFQNLYDRGDLVDVTLACDGKLLHAHKIVLAICSPYFQEIFITNPCKHPIIILKDVTFNIMCELLEFMYQGVVNVKHTELQSFMKIGQLLQIKGLATNASAAAASSPADKSTAQTHNIDEASSTGADAENNSDVTDKQPTAPNRSNIIHADDSHTRDGLTSVKLSNPISVKSHSPASSPSPLGFGSSSKQQSFKSSPDSNMPLQQTLHTGAAASLKRHHADLNNDALSIYSRKQFRRSIASAEHNTTDHSDSADADADSDYFLSSIPHLATNSTAAAAAAAFRNSFNPAAFGFDYNLYKSGGTGGGMGGVGSGGGGGSGMGGAASNNASGVGGGMEYPNDLHIPSDYKNYSNHVDIPPNSSNVVMLSSTSLLHGNCVFNRNNTVATQQGMKTYWLCKSYRISMCRARCITHQGRVISATGVHNHPPHMRGSGGPGVGGNGSGNSVIGGNLGCGGSGGGGGFSVENTMQQSNASVPTSISPTMNLNSINMSGVLLTGSGSNSAAAGSGNINSNIRLHHHTAGASGSGAMGGGPSAMFQQHNSPAQQLQLHHHQQQQQLHLQQQQLHAVDGTTSPPPPPSQMSAQTTISSYMSHHSSSVDGGSLHQQQHHHELSSGGGGGGVVGTANGANGVLHNLLQNASTASALHHHHHHSQLPPMSHHLSQHVHHAHDQSPNHQHQQHQPHLEITPLIHSPPLPPPSSARLHLESPSNHSNQSHHGSGGANSLSSPITARTTTASVATSGPASNSALKSPAQASQTDESTLLCETQSRRAHSSNVNEHQHQHHMLSHHGPTTLSPSEINVTTGGGNGHSDAQQHQAHVIDSITISPNEGHHFKIEDM